MNRPKASRPYMPGYGTLPAHQGTGLLPWSWAEERLRASRNYWLATVSPGGCPHCMPVWGMWIEGCFWFSSSNGSRKARNLRQNPHCTVTTEEAEQPVVVTGEAELVGDVAAIREVVEAENAKYQTDIKIESFDPAVNSTFRVRPIWAFGLRETDFTGSPTRWEFEKRG